MAGGAIMFQCVRTPGSPSEEWLTGKELAGTSRREPSWCGADRCRLAVAGISRRSQSRATSCCFRRRLWPLPWIPGASCSAQGAAAGGGGSHRGQGLGGQGLCLPLGPAFRLGGAAHDSFHPFMGPWGPRGRCCGGGRPGRPCGSRMAATDTSLSSANARR